ncbi:hypothetical protein VP01_317g3 [Puccinia sorghi]|uniref:Uncharacterized protein n=1 Tax=Puccinia sorghi TaxID=27349 RepID=A0A0L6UZG0_9BASI|nr:hypothetical protein VP01_317g3 [Puccinia sorghi]
MKIFHITCLPSDQSWKKIISIVKFYLFSTMDPSLKSQYQHLRQHLIAQTAYQNPNQSNVPQYAWKISEGCKGSRQILQTPKPCS